MGGLAGDQDGTLVDLAAVIAAEQAHLRGREGGLGRWDDLKEGLEGAAGSDQPLGHLFSPEADAAWAGHASLFGIALSGGGIRSATFSLGVLQALASRKLFEQAHYLSTVSGGGYAGGCFNAMNATPPNGQSQGMQSVFAHQPYEQESLAFRHLRSYSRFLAPSGAGDTLRMIAQPLVGAVTNLLVLAFSLILIAACGGVLGYWRDGGWTWWGTTIGVAVAVILGAWMQWQQHCPLAQRSRIGLWLGFSLVFLLVMVFWDVQGYLVRWLFAPDAGWSKWTFWSGVPALAGALGKRLQGQENARLRLKIVLVVVGAVVPMAALYGYLWLISPFFLHSPAPYPVVGVVWLDWLVFYIVLLLGLALATKSVNLNITSPHRFYRDRISEAYIFRQSDNGQTIQSRDDVKLSDLADPRFRAPYPLINTTMNVSPAGGGKHLANMVRHAEWFLFSKLYIGAQSTGFRETAKMEDRDPYINLATAVAISGAAASPNMGQVDLPEVRMLMTLLNVRLGYWLPNPRRTGKSQMDALTLLRTEMFGTVSADGEFVNLSDGGHMENLGIYALIQRQCRLIIASDAEADPDCDLPSLNALIRMIRIDMGLFLTFDPHELAELKAGNRHWIVGTIYYSDDRKGLILYLKSSLTGDEDPSVLAYRKDSGNQFPQESTADQFFSEQQFEAYRWLGYHIANRAVRGQREEIPPGKHGGSVLQRTVIRSLSLPGLLRRQPGGAGTYLISTAWKRWTLKPGDQWVGARPALAFRWVRNRALSGNCSQTLGRNRARLP